MFGHKLSSIPNQNYRLDAYPTIEKLTEMMEKARGMSGVRHNYLWEIPKEFKKYTLSLHCKDRNEETEMEWWLHEENVVGTKMVWFHKTRDIAVIYPHILAAVGAKHPLQETDAERAAREREEQGKQPTSLGARLKRSASSATIEAPPPMEPEEPCAPAPDASIMRLMSGNLRLRPISWLLQTAAQSDLTGELRCESPDNRVVIVQFGLGRPVHAATANKVGTEAVLELFAWTDGISNFIEGKQPETASVQDSADEIIKQGTKLLEHLGYLNKHSMDENSVLSRPPIGLSEEQLEIKLKEGFDYGFKIQRAFYRALDGQLTLRQVGEQISLDTSRLLGVAVNFLKLGLVLTPDGRSLRQIGTPADGFVTGPQQGLKQTGSQAALKPPPGFFGGGGGGGGFGAEMPKTTGETPAFGQSSTSPASDTASGAYSQQAASGAHPQQTVPQSYQGSPQEMSGSHPPQSPPNMVPEPGSVRTSGTEFPMVQRQQDRDFFTVGVPSEILNFEEGSVQEVIRGMTNPQTGALLYPAFQFFLEREYARAFRFSSEFSLLIFCIRLGGEGEAAQAAVPVLPIQALALATQAVIQIKREVDFFGHVGDKCFGLILPNVSTNQSMALVDRIVADLPKLAPKLGGYWPILHFGIAGVPQDARDLPSLMQGAQRAMIEAASKNYTRIRCSDMNS